MSVCRTSTALSALTSECVRVSDVNTCHNTVVVCTQSLLMCLRKCNTVSLYTESQKGFQTFLAVT